MTAPTQHAEGWSLQDVGAEQSAEKAWVYPVGEDRVRVIWSEEQNDGTAEIRSRQFPSEVLAHALRLQGWTCVPPSGEG